MTSRARLGALVLLSIVAVGCAHYPLNAPLPPTGDTGTGYRFPAMVVDKPDPADEIFVCLSFSGGGTRAAAFAYGALSPAEGHRDRASREPPKPPGRSRLRRRDLRWGVHGGVLRPEWPRHLQELLRSIPGAGHSAGAGPEHLESGQPRAPRLAVLQPHRPRGRALRHLGVRGRDVCRADDAPAAVHHAARDQYGERGAVRVHAGRVRFPRVRPRGVPRRSRRGRVVGVPVPAQPGEPQELSARGRLRHPARRQRSARRRGR